MFGPVVDTVQGLVSISQQQDLQLFFTRGKVENCKFDCLDMQLVIVMKHATNKKIVDYFQSVGLESRPRIGPKRQVLAQGLVFFFFGK
jgi:hypothetical protein